MNDQLRQKIIDDLKVSGFEAEMQAIKSFWSTGKWDCTGILSYLDLDENRTRQIDLWAHQSLATQRSDKRWISSSYSIVCEVKKAEKDKPWVVFKERRNLIRDYFDLQKALVVHHSLPTELHYFLEVLDKYSLSRKLGWWGSGIHESFKNPSHSSRSYSAFVTASKAAEYLQQWASESTKDRADSKENAGERAPHFDFFQPLIIFDGLLLSTQLTESGELQIEEIEAAPIKFYFRTKNYGRDCYHIDIVTLAGLNQYIQDSEERHKQLYNEILTRSNVTPVS